MSEIADPSKLKVTELRSELQARGLDSKGNKPVLVERLREALEAEKENEEEEECEAAEESKEEEEVEEVEEENEPEVEESKETAEDKASQEEDNAEQQAAAEPPVDQEEVNEEQIEETPAEETPAEETPAEETPAEETPAEESPAEPAEDQEPVKDADVAESQKEKESFEEAPVEDVDADEEKMEQEEELEDKSAVDLIKDDFFNGHTDELQDLEEDDDVKDESAAVPPVVEEEEVTPATDVKLEAEEDQEKMEEEDEFWDHKRGRKRPSSPIKEEDEAAAKKSRSDEVCIVSPAEAVQTTDVVLDLYNSDLSLKINKETCLSACPHMDKSFAYMWHGARATYGFTKGRVCFEVTLEKNLHVPHIDETEEHPHVLRVGWSVDDSSFTLGEDPRSWGYGGTGKASTDLKFKDYGVTFKAGDVVGAYLDLDVVPAVMSFTVNGEHQGIAYEIGKAEVDDQPLFPHILTKNVRYNVNFGSREEPMATQLEGYTYVGHVPLAERVQGSQGPMHKEDCEVIMMVGLPACGKTTWVQKYVGENKHMKYTVLGTNDLIEKMKVQGVRRKRNYAGRWDQLITSCTKGLNQLLWLSHNRLRNYIIDQTNVYPTAQKRKMKTFAGFKRRAVVICPTDDDLKLRTQKREKEEGKDVPDSAVLEMKANFKLPEVGELFDSIEYVELDKEASEKLVAQYNKEGQEANPEKGSSIASRIGGVSNFNRRDNDRGNRGGYRGSRGSWDRERDRNGGYDRRDRNGSWNRNSRDVSSRLGPRDVRGGGYNRDNRSGYSSYSNRGGGGGSSYRDNRGPVSSRTSYGGDSDQYKYQNSNYSSSNWSQGSTPYGQGYGYGAGYGMQGYAATTSQSYNQSYNWPQHQYGQQQTYYQQGYRADTAAAAAPASSTTSGYYAQQMGSWGTTPAATSSAAQPTQNVWGTPGYAQSQQTWGSQSYGGGYGGYKK